MIIEKVELKNIKLYKQRTFEFCKGINVLSGPNGSGKSTVFEAIGYALFGVDAKDFIGNEKRFVRKGEKNGSVVVHFMVDDGNRYMIERRVGGKSWRLLHVLPEGGKRAVEVKNDAELEIELKKILGLKSDQPLDKQFLGIIGPLQSDFIGPFLRPGRPRQDEFDKILGINSWREIFDQTVDLKNEARRQVERREDDIERKTADVANYDLVAGEWQARRQRLSEKQAERERTLADLSAATQAVAALDRAKSEIERLQNERAALAEQEQTLKIRRDAAEQQRQRARQAKALCDTLEPGYRAYTEAEAALQPLRAEEKAAAQWRLDLAAMETDVVARQSSVDTRRQSLGEQYRRAEANRQKAAEELVQLRIRLEAAQEAVQQTEQSVNAYEAFQLKGKDLAERPHRMRDEATRLIKDAIPIAAGLAAQEERLRRKKDLEIIAQQESELERNYQIAVERLSDLEARRKQLREGNAKLAGGTCPFFEESCLNLEQKGSAPDNFFGRRIEDLTQEVEEATRRKREGHERLKEVRNGISELSQLLEVQKQYTRDESRLMHSRRQLEKALQPLMSGAFLRDVADWIQDAPQASQTQELRQYLDVRPIDVAVDGEWAMQAQSVLNACAPLETMIAQIQDRMTQHKRALAQQQRTAGEDLARLKEQSKNLERSKSEAEQEIQSLQKEKDQWIKDRDEMNRRKAALDALKASAPSYEGLAERIQALDAVLQEHAQTYRECLSHRQVAGEVADREAEVAGLEEKLSTLAMEAARLQPALEQSQAAYRDEDHETARGRRQDLDVCAAQLHVEIQGLTSEVSRLESEKRRMDEIRRQIKSLESEVRQYRKTLRFVEDMRDKVFKKVSEQLSERYREEISQLADRIYRVIARSDEELHWGPNYAIELVDMQNGGERRRFDEELSGGQVMSAVVSLRLALLRTYGAKIGFFDEPTSNLDEVRRANLALAFRSLDEGKGDVGSPWYDQLFLISHDVAFTEITDQIIHLGEES